MSDLFLTPYIKVGVKFLNAQPHYADSLLVTYRSTLKLFAFLEETNLYFLTLPLPKMLSVILNSI
jgi:hypothetical protein